MTCASCGSENRTGRKFCSTCGAALAIACPNCGSANESGERFCGECGNALDSAAALPVAPQASSAVGMQGGRPAAGPWGATGSVAPVAPVAERRFVTVLFADLVGFTPFAEERDAEEVRETLTRYFDIARDVIERHGGIVEKFIGDAVMALWGAPVAREDDPERAVRAGLELVAGVRQLGPSMSARAGILSGEAAVTLGATNQGMVAGDIVNTAARLQSVAPPGAVLVGEGTYRAASEAIAFEAVGDAILKGKAAPVPAWLALRVIAERGGRGRSGGLEAPFVGREDELRLLKDMFHATTRERRTRLVSIIGPGGIGKSRLAWEFEKYLDGIVGTVWWHHGRSPAYGQGISFWALGEMIRARAGLAEADDEPTTRVRIAEMLAKHIPEEAERRWLEPSFLALLGVDGGPVKTDDLFAAWRTLFERLAASGPVVLVFEDLHWADAGLLDFIDHLLEWSASQPLFVITLARPDLLERRTDWGAGRRNFLSIGLEPLPESAMRQLLAGLVPGLPEGTLAAIVSRADGIPLYAVETIRMLVADGRLIEEGGAYVAAGDLTTLAIPETLTALIGARLDGLEAADRALIQDAAVLGQSFTLGGLAAVSAGASADLEPRLRVLVRRELLTHKADARSPERGQYAFVQALIREVAYNTLAKRDRRERHLAAARHFEALGTDELAGALAGHYLAAHANTPEGPEADALAVQARLALTGAAERAAALGSNLQALGFFEQALRIGDDPVKQADLNERAGDAAQSAGQYLRSEELLRAALAAHEATGNRPAAARMVGKVARAMSGRLDTPGAHQLLTDAVDRYADLGEDPEYIGLMVRLATSCWILEDLPRAIEWADRAADVAERLDLVPLIADALIIKGGALGYSGRGYEGMSVMRGGLDLAEAGGLTMIALRAQVNLSDAQIPRDPHAALATARAGLEVARRLGRQDYLATLVLNGSYAAMRTGDWDWILAEVDGTLPGVTEGPDRAGILIEAVVIRASRGEPVDPTVDEIVGIVTATADPQANGTVRDMQANIALANGRLGDAFDDALAAASMTSWLAPMAYLLAARAALWEHDLGRAQQALALLATTTHGPAIAASRATIEAGILALEGGRPEALHAYREALRAWRDLGLPWDEALTGLDMAILLGPAEGDVDEAAGTAGAIFARLGAVPFTERLNDAMVAQEGAPASASLGG